MHTRICCRCKQEKSLEEFYKSKYSALGHIYMCRSCRKKKEKQEWHKRLYRTARGRKTECTITKEYILELFKEQNGLCYWYGIPMIPTDNPKDPQQPSLDRLDPHKGYVKGNVVLTCFAANIGRNRTSQERFEEFSKLLREKCHGQKAILSGTFTERTAEA